MFLFHNWILLYSAHAVLKAVRVATVAPPQSSLQETTIEDGMEEPDLSLPVHPTVDNSTVPEVRTEANPAVVSPVHVSAEKDAKVEVIWSQFVERTDTSNVLAKVVADVKPATSSKVSIPDTGSLENQDFSSLLQELSQNWLREDGIVAMLKKKYEVSSSPFVYNL